MTGGEQPVQLYVYDLSQGMARQFSMALTGRQFDAVYHTSIVVGGKEIYYGAGIQYSSPGATHHGRPLEIIQLGSTSLPDAVISQYIDSMKEIYSAESYDLFMRNCNNFSNDLSMFLVGKGIPSHIVSLPQDVLNTPFGQMLRPQIESALRPITTAPSVTTPNNRPPSYINSLATPAVAQRPAPVKIPANNRELNTLLHSEKGKKLTTIFFTSAGCPPCRVVYPHFEELAEEYASKGTFVKVDVGEKYDIGSAYQIRATPTFITFVNGEKLDQWTGGQLGTLKANFNMALNIAYPPHPHSMLRLPVTLGTSTNSIKFGRVPPLDKLLIKMGDNSMRSEVEEMKSFIMKRQEQGAIDAPLPDLPKWSNFLITSLESPSLDAAFPVVDFFRLALMDTRVSGYYAEEQDHKTVTTMLQTLATKADAPYALRLVTLQAACNCFTSNLFPPYLLSSPLSPLLAINISNALLDTTHAPARVAASSLAFNVAAFNQKSRVEHSKDLLSDDDLVQLTASIVEAIEREKESHEAFRGCLLALAMLVYGAQMDGELIDLVNVLQAGPMILEKAKSSSKALLGDDGNRLCKEIGEELLGKGLRRQ